MDAINSFGCIACWLDGYDETPCVVHHMLSGNRRIGHHATIGLCPAHHHRSTSGLSVSKCIAIGPSWHEQRREFRARYGSDTELVAMQSEVIGVQA